MLRSLSRVFECLSDINRCFAFYSLTLVKRDAMKKKKQIEREIEFLLCWQFSVKDFLPQFSLVVKRQSFTLRDETHHSELQLSHSISLLVLEATTTQARAALLRKNFNER